MFLYIDFVYAFHLNIVHVDEVASGIRACFVQILLNLYNLLLSQTDNRFHSLTVHANLYIKSAYKRFNKHTMVHQSLNIILNVGTTETKHT